MARLTKQERATLKQLSERAKAEDDADAEYELTVETANGHRVTLKGDKARRYAAKHQLDLDDEPDDEPDDDASDELDDDEDDDEQEPAKRSKRTPAKLPPDPPAGGEGGYFRRR